METENKVIIEEPNESKNFPFFRIIIRNWVLILVLIIVCGIGGTMLGFITTKPVYTVKCDVMLKVYQNRTDKADTSLAKRYLPTIADTMVTPEVQKYARDNYKVAVSVGAVSITYNEDSLIFSVSYSDSNKEDAEKKLEAFLLAADFKMQEKTPVPVKKIQIVKMQNKNYFQVTDNKFQYTPIALAGGLVLGVIVAVLIYLLDNKVKDGKELESITGVSVLSYIDKV